MHTPFDSKFSFTYKEKNYTMPYKEGSAEWSTASGLYINRPDIFNGTINYRYPNCAWLEPVGTNVQMDYNNCKLESSGFPIDSVAVYVYESGSVIKYYKNCHTKKEYNYVSDQFFSYKVCDEEGTFNLVLKNKENKTIVITDGKFQVYSVRQ
ncbi:MAG: hypothetical protein ACXWCG_01585 [Flavitalea sp.]